LGASLLGEKAQKALAPYPQFSGDGNSFVRGVNH
jgi:hypothetical protein